MRSLKTQGLIQRAIYRPQSLWLRRALFQAHLWTGIALALYAVVIGVSGSILVFREELTILADRGSGPPRPTAINIAEAVKAAARAASGQRIIAGVAPAIGSPTYFFEFANRQIVYVDPASGAIVPPVEQETWLDFVGALHARLLLQEFTANGVGTVGLLVLIVTGLLIWWRGMVRLPESLRIGFHSGWRRIVWDLHAVGGFYGSLMVVMWCLTGLLLIWPSAMLALMTWASPVTQSSVPKVPPGEASAETIFRYAAAEASLWPGRLHSVRMPAAPGEPVTLVMAREPGLHSQHYDQIYLNPVTGARVGTRFADEGKTFTDAVCRLAYPFHTGIFWGLAVKVLWALLGLLLPMLAITGLMMYWNRYLGRQWRKFRAPAAKLTTTPP